MRSHTLLEQPTDAELLREFCDRGSEAAFKSLVEAHLGLVVGAALRRTGNRALAEEISQTVFAILARKADDVDVSARLDPLIGSELDVDARAWPLQVE